MTNRSLINLDQLSTLFTHQIVTASCLVRLGVSVATLKRKCLPSGQWQLVQPGVVLLSKDPPTRRQQVQAALCYVKDSIATGHDALALHGIRACSPRGRVELLVSYNNFTRGNGTVRISRTTSPPRPALRDGLLVAPLARAAMDAARRMTAHREVLALFTEVVFKGGVRLDELRTELVVGGNRGATLPNQVLHEIGARVRADVASSARMLIARAGLPPPRWNVPVTDPAGNPLGTVTGTWDDVGLAWDVHAFDFDPVPAGYPTALKRGSHLAARGLRVVHTLAAEIRAKPAGVIAELRSAHAQLALMC